MAHLTRPTKYDIKDSNIALLGSDLEKRVREHSGDSEHSWEGAGQSIGLQIWRIEKFHVVPWPSERIGSFYDGDSYIVLHTYKKDPKSESLSYDLHFWLGANTTQDEAGTAAYKTVELDDHLHGLPVQYREAQGYESALFLSYFPHFIALKGGVSTGFHHISAPPPLDLHKLYRITLSRFGTRSSLVVREVLAEGSSLIEGDVYVLDKGIEVWQYNTKASAGQERFKAAEFVQKLVSERKGQCNLTVYDEGGHGSGIFTAEFGITTLRSESAEASSNAPPKLFRISDSTGIVTFEPVIPASLKALSSDDAFLLDNSAGSIAPAIYVWIGKNSSMVEQRLALQYGQKYLHDEGHARPQLTLVKMAEGRESEAFLQAIGA